MNIIRVLSCELIKLKRTPASIVFLSVPIAFPILLLGYLKLSAGSTDVSYQAFEVIFQLESIGLPVILGLLAGLMGEQERDAGDLQNLKIYQRPGKYFLFKCLFLGSAVFICIFASIGIFLLGLKFFLNAAVIQPQIFLLAGSFMFLGAAFLLPLSLYVSLLYGQGPSIGIGGAGFLVAALIGTTTVGEKFWFLIPWSWPARLSWSAILLDKHLAWPSSIDIAKVFSGYMLHGLIPAVAFGVLLLIFSAKIFEKKLLQGQN